MTHNNGEGTCIVPMFKNLHIHANFSVRVVLVCASALRVCALCADGDVEATGAYKCGGRLVHADMKNQIVTCVLMYYTVSLLTCNMTVYITVTVLTAGSQGWRWFCERFCLISAPWAGCNKNEYVIYWAAQMIDSGKYVSRRSMKRLGFSLIFVFICSNPPVEIILLVGQSDQWKSK